MNVRSYGSFDEMMSDMAAAEAEANEKVTDIQRQITWGSKAMALVYHGTTYIPIFGSVYSKQHLWDSERKYYPEKMSDEQDEEFSEILSNIEDAHERGYRYGDWFSILEPAGEIGSHHIVNLYPITDEDFEVAKASGWESLPIERMREIPNQMEGDA